MKSLFYLVVLFISYPAFCQQTVLQNVIPNLALSRVTIHIKYKNNTGTAFLYKASDSATYLITAKHIFNEEVVIKKLGAKDIKIDSFKYRNGDLVSIEFREENEWIKLQPTPLYINRKQEVDIVVIKLPNDDIGYNPYSIERGMTPLMGQDCFFLGFPLNIKTIPYERLPVPLVKKAILSTVINTKGDIKIPSNTTLALLDGNNTIGFSGGPIFYFDSFKNKWCLLGVISGYYLQRNEIKENEYYENSGIIYCMYVTHLIEIFESIGVII